MQAGFIGIDWGTSSFRAALVGGDGRTIARSTGPDGILTVAGGDFEAVLERHIGAWDRALPVIASGMIGSRQGWVETPYCDCPAGPAAIAARLVFHTTAAGRRIAFVPGLACRGEAPDVMRGEETQVLGAGGEGLFVLPGTHSKWVEARGGGIARFMTFMTGELYAALRTHTILGRLMQGEAHDATAFARGVAAGQREPALLPHLLFSTRTLGLTGEIAPEHLGCYLSGLLIGAEVAGGRQSFPTPARVEILATEPLAARYLEAFALAEIPARAGDADAAVLGQALIARAAGLIR